MHLTSNGFDGSCFANQAPDIMDILKYNQYSSILTEKIEEYYRNNSSTFPLTSTNINNIIQYILKENLYKLPNFEHSTTNISIEMDDEKSFRIFIEDCRNNMKYIYILHMTNRTLMKI